MRNVIVKVALACCAYGGLLLAIVMYGMMSHAFSNYSNSFDRLAPVIITGFYASVVALISNIVTITKYKGALRWISIAGLLASLIVAALLFPAFGFTVS